MLRLAKKDVRSIYTVTDDGGHSITPLRSTGSWGGVSTTVDGAPVEVTGSTAGGFVIARSGQQLASLHSPGGRSTEVLVEHDGPTLRLVAAKSTRFDASIDGSGAGDISLVGWAGRRVEADLPQDLPVEVRLLATFHALRSWNLRAHG
jgi:hypothetical protein